MLGFGAISENAISALPDRLTTPNVLHAKMLQRIAALEAAMAQLSPPPIAGLGHNGPPESIDGQPLSSEDRAAIVAAVMLLKAQRATAPTHSAEVITAAKRLQSAAETIGKWLADKGDVFASEFAKTAGAETAKWAFRLTILALLLREVADAAMRWLEALLP
jgi:hypothetical protein